MAELHNLNHHNTPQKQPRDIIEQVQTELKKLLSAVGENSKKFAGAALTIMTLSTSAHAADEMTVAINSSPTASVPTAEKGGGQVVNIDGKEYTFNQISKLPREEKGVILKKMGTIDPMLLEDYNDFYLQAANQEEKQIDTNIQAANQEEKKIDKHLIIRYEQYISNIEKGSKGEKVIIEKIINAKFIPDDLKKRAQAILQNKNIILSGI